MTDRTIGNDIAEFVKMLRAADADDLLQRAARLIENSQRVIKTQADFIQELEARIKELKGDTA